MLHAEKPDTEPALFQIRRVLHEKNIEAFCVALRVLFTHIPYSLHIQKEAYYHSIFQLIGTLLGLDVQSEVATSVGRIDLVVRTAKYIYIFECKFNKTSEEALSQIKKQRYYEKYLDSGKEIVLVGMLFCFKEKQLVIECSSEQFKNN